MTKKIVLSKFRDLFCTRNFFLSFRQKQKFLSWCKQKKMIGSSETTRKAPLKPPCCFNFSKYWSIMPRHKKKNKTYISFLTWFIGFVEGDGCFAVRKPCLPNNPKHRLIFEVGQKDPKVLYYIKEKLGFGRVVSYTESKTGNKYWKFFIGDKKNILKIISIFYGNLVLPTRRVQFNKWLSIANKINCLPKGISLARGVGRKAKKEQFITQGVKVSLDNGWLAGFIDAEGCFYANITNTHYIHLRQKMHITQKSLFSDDIVLKEIGELFGSTCKPRQVYASKKEKISNSPSQNYRIELSCLVSHTNIVRYLTKYPLKTAKHRAFLKWANIVQARSNNEHLDPKRYANLLKNCQIINKFNNTP